MGRCNNCGKELDENPYAYGDELFCSTDCRREKHPEAYCTICGYFTPYNFSQRNPDTGEPICHSCFNENWTYCDCCNELVNRNDAVWGDEGAYCCEEHRIQLEPIHCSDIYSYNAKPMPLFHGDVGSHYFGVELERDSDYAQDPYLTEEELLDFKENLFYLKRDGSLKYGFEVVSQPCSLKYHLNIFPWKGILDTCHARNYEGLPTAGMHVHVSKASLGRDEQHRLETIKNLIWIFFHYSFELKRLANRANSESLDRWASFPTENDAKRTLDISAYSLCRYKAINTSNANTVEFRIFSSPNSVEEIYANIELCDYLCNLATMDFSKLIETKIFNMEDISERYPYLYEKCKQVKIFESEVA